MLIDKPLALLIFGNSEADHLKGVTKEREYLPDLFFKKNKEYGYELKVIGYSEKEKILEFIDENAERIFLLYFSGHSSSNQIEADDGGIYRAGLVRKISCLDNIKLVFFNGCRNQRIIDELASRTNSINLIGSRDLINDSQAVFFAGTLFKSLIVLGETVGEAFKKSTDNMISVSGDYRSMDGVDSHTKLPWYAILKDPSWTFDYFAGFCEKIPKLPTGEYPFPSKPFKGVLSYNERDAQVFFGRCEEIFKTLEFLKSENKILIIQGQSGSGKSSLINAGIFPRVKALGYSFFKLNIRNYQFNKDDKKLAERDVVIFDQVEYLFTDQSEKQRQNFFEFIQVFFDKNPKRKAIFSIRTEYYGRFSDELLNLLGLSFSSFILRTLSFERIVEIIERAKEKILDSSYQTIVKDPEDGPKLSEIIASDLVEDDQGRIDGSKNVAPVLQMILYDLYEAVKNNNVRVIDVELYYSIKKEGIGIVEQIKKKISKIKAGQPWGKVAYDNGLIIDVLYFHTDSNQRAVKIPLALLFRKYHHIPFIKNLIQELINEHLLIKISGKDDSSFFTIVSHDAFCKYLHQIFYESDRPGQIARKALTYAVRNYSHAGSTYRDSTTLDSQSIRKIKQGRYGTYDWESNEIEKEIVSLSIKNTRKKRVLLSPLYFFPVLILFLLGFFFPDSMIPRDKYQEMKSLYRADSKTNDDLFMLKHKDLLDELFSINDIILFEGRSIAWKYFIISDTYVKKAVILLKQKKYKSAELSASNAIKFSEKAGFHINSLSMKKGDNKENLKNSNYFNISHAYALSYCAKLEKNNELLKAVTKYQNKITDSNFFELALLNREDCFDNVLTNLLEY